MLLEPSDAQLFFRLHRSVLFFVNRRFRVTPDDLSEPNAFTRWTPDVLVKFREVWLANIDLLDSFADENPSHFSNDELDIIRSWRHFVAGEFYVFRQLAKHTIFLSTSEPVVAYGVLALTQSFDEILGRQLPALARAVLLPFKGKIIHDGVVSGFNMSFGPGIRRSMNEDYKRAKERQGIVTSLPISDKPVAPKPPKPKLAPKPPSKQEKDDVLRTLIGMIDKFCEEHLNEEYAVLCRKLAEKLARKRPSPLLHGKLNAWASAIVRAIGGVNFLHDASQTPYMRSTDIDRYFGTSPSTGSAKLAEIRKMVKLHQLDPNWILPSRLEDNPLVWLLNVNGFLVDIRDALREAQEIALKKGRIRM
jgi:hypothetical protein